MSRHSNTDNGILGPSFLEGLTEHILNPDDLQDHEWRRRIKSVNGNTRFRIKYYGELHENYDTLITGTEFSEALILAEDLLTGEEILLFDGCKHGYNALLCDTFTDEQIKNRKAEQIYKDKNGNDQFEIIISTYNGIDFEEEFSEDVDDNGQIELVDGSKVEFAVLKRNGYDTLQIWGIDKAGKTIEIVSEELA